MAHGDNKKSVCRRSCGLESQDPPTEVWQYHTALLSEVSPTGSKELKELYLNIFLKTETDKTNVARGQSNPPPKSCFIGGGEAWTVLRP